MIEILSQLTKLAQLQYAGKALLSLELPAHEYC